MKIVTSHPSRLIIADRPVALSLLLLGTSLLCLGHLVARWWSKGLDEETFGALLAFLVFATGFVIFARNSVFDFDLRRRQLSWRKRSLFGSRGTVVPFHEIQNAHVQSIASSDGGGLSYRVTLFTEGAELPLSENYDFGRERECEEIAAAINQAVGTAATER